ncbi:pilus assembly protein PilM [Microbacterium sp. B2969]|uniref:Pilus assembly protein PilM n=1 Tax=Microbacterium alkaliflavum TaxID=3248839 RepID=A0ABW7QCA1_9MICO
MGRTVVGLEITEESVRAAQIAIGRTPQLVGYGEVPLPADAARDSEITDAGAVAVALRQLWTGAGFKGKEVTLGVASRRILVREYTTQAMKPELLREALPYQVQDFLPVPASQAVLDFFPLSYHDDQVSGLLVAAISESIEQIIATLDRVKLRARAIDLAAFGLARTSALAHGRQGTVAAVHIGDHTTQFVVSTGGIPQFVRLLPIDVPTAAVQARLGQTAEIPVEAEMLELVPAAAAPAPRTRGALRSSTGDPVVSDLVARVRSTLAFYASRPNALPVDEVLLSGAGANVAGVVPGLTAGLDVPVRVVSVGEIVAVKSSGITPDLALNLVSTVGVALGEVR